MNSRTTEANRPWWLILNKSSGLITKVEEESIPGKQTFIVRGEPLVQGLTWLIWGPVGAVLMVALLATLAISFNIREQSWGLKGLFIGLFFALPTLTWAGISLMMKRASEKYIEAERKNNAQVCTIHLDQEDQKLSCQTMTQAQPIEIAYQQIRQAKLTQPVGAKAEHIVRLTLETDEGEVTLLNEKLGTKTQKEDLIEKIQNALQQKISVSSA